MGVDLKKIPLFEGVPEADLRELGERTVTRTYPKQAIIVSEGDESDSLFLILAGRVKIYLADEHGAHPRDQGTGSVLRRDGAR